MKFILAALIMAISTPARSDCVILLHGLKRTSKSLLVMQTGLQGIGYDVLNINYPSTKDRIEDLSAKVIGDAIKSCEGAQRIHFVTHSMGGILVRYYLEHIDEMPKNLGHVVMLAPPNNGSPIVDKLGHLAAFEILNGVAATQLGTQEDGLMKSLGKVEFSLGVIAGEKSVSPVLSSMIEGKNDGKVAVESTKVGGMADHITLPVTHTYMMNNPIVFKQVTHFLREGRFKHDT